VAQKELHLNARPELTGGAATVAKGFSIQGGSVQKAESEIADWLQKSGVLKGAKK
jgi:hypothetical protein